MRFNHDYEKVYFYIEAYKDDLELTEASLGTLEDWDNTAEVIWKDGEWVQDLDCKDLQERLSSKVGDGTPTLEVTQKIDCSQRLHLYTTQEVAR